MPRLALAALGFLTAASAAAQRIPGRDLLTYPLGLIGEPAALGVDAAGGLWNPASGELGPKDRYRVAVSALNAPIDLSLAGQVLHAASALRGGTFTVSLVHASIGSLAHTETDPQSLGDDVPYYTFVASAGWMRRMSPHVVAGAALRWHTGTADGVHAHTFTTDGGVVFDHLAWRDATVGVSTFMWTQSGSDAPVFEFAADARAAGTDSLRAVRAGLARTHTRGAATEWYPYANVRYGKLELRGGPVRVEEFGATTTRMRLAFALHHGTYSVGLVREDNESGLTPTYQLSLANVIR